MSRTNPSSGSQRQGGLNATLKFEAPDILVTALIGDLDAADTARIAAEARRIAAARSWALLLCDISRIGTLTSEARRTAVDGFRAVPIRGIAFYGGSRNSRSQSTLMANAMSLLSSRRDESPIRFFMTEAEARTWLGQRRDELKRVQRR
ncbi:hypothetical protein [Chondromyces crocatus]|nr:hypothetical protein [Chondromyces crocatus]